MPWKQLCMDFNMLFLIKMSLSSNFPWNFEILTMQEVKAVVAPGCWWYWFWALGMRLTCEVSVSWVFLWSPPWKCLSLMYLHQTELPRSFSQHLLQKHMNFLPEVMEKMTWGFPFFSRSLSSTVHIGHVRISQGSQAWGLKTIWTSLSWQTLKEIFWDCGYTHALLSLEK